MSLFESGDSSGTVSIKSLFDGTFSDHITGNVSLKDIAYLSIRGGWPGIIGCEEKAAIQNAKDYITSFLEDELPRIDDFRKFRDTRKMKFILESLARNESTTATISTIRRDISAATDSPIKEETINEYLDILQRVFLIEDQKAFSFSARSGSRLKNLPKDILQIHPLPARFCHLRERSSLMICRLSVSYLNLL